MGLGTAAQNQPEINVIQKKIQRVIPSIRKVIRGKDSVIEEALIALLSGGHVLLEDIPGMGKTLLGLALARSIQSSFKRIQFTNDTIPADIIGAMIYSKTKEAFSFVPGPVFAGIVLADEINRTSPKTQSAFLEAMAERKVSVENKVFRLPDPFLVIATQNPVEFAGTFPLPESQMDRFLLRTEMGYPDLDSERAILLEDIGPDLAKDITPVISTEEIMEARKMVKAIHLDPSVIEYLLNIVRATRDDKRLSLAVSPRGSLMLKTAVQARSFIRGREYVLPDDVKALAAPVLAHRMLPEGRSSGGVAARQEVQSILAEILDQVPVPV